MADGGGIRVTTNESDLAWDVLVLGDGFLALRAKALAHNGGVFLLSTCPWSLLVLPGLWLLRRDSPLLPPIVYGLLLFFGVALVFPVSSMAGTFYYSIGALKHLLALVAATAIYVGVRRLAGDRRRVNPRFATLMAGLLIPAGAQLVTSYATVPERHQAEMQQFEAVTAWPAQHSAPGDVGMSTQPYTLNHARGHPCIVLPGSESPEAARAAAQRCGARFLVLVQRLGQYPQIPEEQPGPRFQLVSSDEDTRIYAIQGGQP